MLKKNKIYTLKELMLLSEKTIKIKQILNIHDVKISRKDKICKFEDFDQETKYIYLFIANQIKKLNSNQKDLFVIAIGSRIKGNWKTKKESEDIAKKLNTKNIKYSDYDFSTNAKNIPDLKIISKQLNVKVDMFMHMKNGVYIPLN